MARRPKLRLTQISVAAAKKPGLLADGDGLYLQVTESGAKSWIYMFRWQGKRPQMGLGSADVVKLKDARGRAADARALVESGINPIMEKRTKRAAQSLVPKFGPFALDRIEKKASGWKTAKKASDWKRSIEVHAKAIFDLPVDQITVEDVMDVLKPLWNKKQETANQTRRRVEDILDAARVLGLRSGDNPARWKGGLKLMMPQVRIKVEHHPAMPYQEIPAFMVELRKRTGVASAALEFLIYTTARTAEICFAEKSEVDYFERVWTVPADRMKGEREHDVPLPDNVAGLAKNASKATGESNPYLFGSPYHRKPLSTGAMDTLLERMGFSRYTVHGFRSTFRDWAGDKSAAPKEVAEAALAHMVGDKTEQAYRRGTALEKRRELMREWANYLDARPHVPAKPPAFYEQ